MVRRGWQVVDELGKVLHEVSQDMRDLEDAKYGSCFIYDWQSPIAAGRHGSNGGSDRLICGDARRLRRHELVDRRTQVGLFGDNAERVSLGEDAHQLAVFADNGASVALILHSLKDIFCGIRRGDTQRFAGTNLHDGIGIEIELKIHVIARKPLSSHKNTNRRLGLTKSLNGRVVIRLTPFLVVDQLVSNPGMTTSRSQLHRIICGRWPIFVSEIVKKQRNSTALSLRLSVLAEADKAIKLGFSANFRP